uniref:Uncharacterized protein n=1 Tax=Ciona savignyi TaxID=51511 RepID=H2YY19_CIOSA
MSLFPSAAAVKSQPDKPPGKEWLENKSFKVDDAEALRKHQKYVKEEPYNLFPSTFKEEVTSPTQYYSDIESESDSDSEIDRVPSTSVKPEFDDLLSVDKTPDKNNLYFSKPYRVPIPRFYRCVDSCVGLPSYLQIVFNQKKKRKRKLETIEPRYFHKQLVQEETFEETTDPIKTETELLNIETRENPTNIDGWLKLAELQDRTHKKSLKFATEKKVSILDKAIAANPRNVDLKLKRLSFLENIFEDSDREWKNLVFQHPGDKSAWKAYIQHTMTGVSFKVHRTLKAFEKCIQTVSALRFQ